MTLGNKIQQFLLRKMNLSYCFLQLLHGFVLVKPPILNTSIASGLQWFNLFVRSPLQYLYATEDAF